MGYYNHNDDEKDNDNDKYLEFERMGYNVITNTLKDTIGGNVDKLSNNLERLNYDIEQELLWLSKKIGSVFSDQPNMNNNYIDNTFKSEITFKWEDVDKDT